MYRCVYIVRREVFVMDGWMDGWIDRQVHTCTQVYICIYICICMHIHMHIHMIHIRYIYDTYMIISESFSLKWRWRS